MTPSGIEPATFRFVALVPLNFNIVVSSVGKICLRRNCSQNKRLKTMCMPMEEVAEEKRTFDLTDVLNTRKRSMPKNFDETLNRFLQRPL